MRRDVFGEPIIGPDRSRQFVSSDLLVGTELLQDLKFTWMPNRRDSISETVEDLTKECVICLEHLFETEVVRLSCHPNHVFHFSCIEKWLM